MKDESFSATASFISDQEKTSKSSNLNFSFSPSDSEEEDIKTLKRLLEAKENKKEEIDEKLSNQNEEETQDECSVSSINEEEINSHHVNIFVPRFNDKFKKSSSTALNSQRLSNYFNPITPTKKFSLAKCLYYSPKLLKSSLIDRIPPISLIPTKSSLKLENLTQSLNENLHKKFHISNFFAKISGTTV